jgi:hypothetical protein
MDTSNNNKTSEDEWTSKTKRLHSSSFNHSLSQTPANANKNKKLFFTFNWFEILSQNDPPFKTPMDDNNTDPFQHHMSTIHTEPNSL